MAYSPPPNLGEQDWLINAIGITKPFINATGTRKAIVINALLPFELAKWSTKYGIRVLQIATDCVYSGQKGQYRESDGHDALDVYGKTKSLGEISLENYHHLRTSIIGLELKSSHYLLEWLLSQPAGAIVSGYTNHLWDGVTTLHFARICLAIIRDQMLIPQLQHIVPTGQVSKYELLKLIARNFKLDVTIRPVETDVAIDRTLATENSLLNRNIWQAAGYMEPPSMAQMVSEYAEIVS